MTDKTRDQKKDQLLAALDKGMAMIHLDARRPGVRVPENLRQEPHLLLNLSYRFDPPDLSVNEWGVRSTLSFSGSRFTVAVPWSALYGITSHVTKDFFIYPDDMPEEVLAQAQMIEKVPTDQPPFKKGAPLLREVPMDEKDAAPAPKEPTAPPSRAHLRLVK